MFHPDPNPELELLASQWLVAGLIVLGLVIWAIDSIRQYFVGAATALRNTPPAEEAAPDIEAIRQELLHAEVTDLTSVGGDVALLRVRRPYDTEFKPLLVDLSRLSASTRDTVLETGAPIVHRPSRRLS